MDSTRIYQDLTAIFHEVFERQDLVLSPDLTARDVEGWDSFKMIEIIIATETHFAIKLTTREIDGLLCIGDLARAVQSKAAASAG